MHILSILQEGISAVLFHATTINSALKILQADALTSKSGDVSFTRSLAGEYHSYYKIIGIIFEVDGRAISARYKGKPVAGYHHDYREEDWYDPDYESESDQMEDRVQTSSIKHFTRYVKRAIIYVPEEYLKNSNKDELGEDYLDNLKNVFALIEVLRKANISFRTVTSHAGLFDKKRDDTAKLPELYKALQNGFDDVEEEDENGEEESPYVVAVEYSDETVADDVVYKLSDGNKVIKRFTYGQIKTQSGMSSADDHKRLEAFLHKTGLVPANMSIYFYET